MRSSSLPSCKVTGDVDPADVSVMAELLARAASVMSHLGLRIESLCQTQAFKAL